MFRRIFHFKKWESVRVLHVNFGTLDFTHLYDLHRWKFVLAMRNNGVYWSEFVNILDIQFHESLFISEKYNDGSMSCSVAACIFRHSKYVLVYVLVFLLFSFFYFYISAFVANKDIYCD